MRKAKSIRYKSSWAILGCPLLVIAFGPDAKSGQGRGFAKGIIAIGNMAVGVIAIGGLASGGLAIGGISVGALGIGGVSLGGLVLAGVAVGYGTLGGVSVGHYARGGAVVGTHVICRDKADPEAVRFFNHFLPARKDPEGT